ncbi:MAG: glucodextranase DOMON-like domain-containing protein [Candidatus Eisenbacteria bacterium]
MRLRYYLVLPVLAASLAGAPLRATATTHNTPLIDGVIGVAAADWDENEQLLADPTTDSRYHEADLDKIYVTWDAENLYIGIQTRYPPGGFGNGYLVFIDKDAQASSMTGATDFTRANFYPRHITFTGMGADVVVTTWSLTPPVEIKDCTDPTKAREKPIPGAAGAANSGLFSFEVKIPWSGMYPGSATTIPRGSKLRIVAATVGGDNSGAYDAAPSSGHDSNGNGIPDESDPATAWDGYTDLDRFLEIPLDANLDGLPDQGYPPSGGISGAVTLSDASDRQTVTTIDAYLGSTLYATAKSPRGGGAYQLVRMPDGAYMLEAYADSYRKARVTNVVVMGGGAVDGINFSLIKVTGAVIGSVRVEGPPSEVTIFVEDPATGAVGGDGKKMIPTGTGNFSILTVDDGTFNLVAEARGYVRQTRSVTISGGDTARIDVVLAQAAATRYAFVDQQGNEIRSRSISRSLPAGGIFDFADLVFEPRDDAGNIAIFDVAATDSVRLAATLLDRTVNPRGRVIFADTLGNPLLQQILDRTMFNKGVGRFLVSDDSVEVLRVDVERNSIRGAIEVGVGELKPASVSLTRAQSEVAVGERVDIGVQLLDASGNPTPTSDVAVRMKAIRGSPVFEPDVGITDANGFFATSVLAFKADTVQVTSEVEPGALAGLPSDTVSVVFIPGLAYEVTSRVEPRAVKAGGESQLKFQVVDQYGNNVSASNLRIDVAASPDDLLDLVETPVTTDAAGAAASHLRAGHRYGLVALEATSSYPVAGAKLLIDSKLVAVDEAAPETQPSHSNPNVDLTTMFALLVPDTLKVVLDFVSSWEGVHAMLALKTTSNPAGGDGDPFGFPVNYGHTLRPDFVFTYKYSANDYADLRRWTGSGWEYWHLAEAAWITDGNNAGKNALPIVTKTETQVVFAFPLAAVGNLAPGDTIRLEAYVTQQVGDNKYTALDSDPPDNTHDMLPAQGNWYDTATNDRTLSNWALYVFPTPGAAPSLSSAQAVPQTASPGDRVNLSVTVVDQGGGIGDVLADISVIGGDASTRLYDNGAGGDVEAGDNIYSLRFTIPEVVPQGVQTVWFMARDSLNISETGASAPVTIVNPPDVIVAAPDSVGDDHGPNLTDTSGRPIEGLYYLYPTNGVFAPGLFDITKVDFMIDGPFLVIRVYLGELPSSEAVGWNAPYPGETCANPNKADLNLQKIDVYIDTKEGSGATAGLPFRYVDISRSDAWEFAAVSEGWWKGLVESNGQNSIAFWTIKRQSNQIDFCDDHVANLVDVKIALAVLGNPIPDDIKKWDFIITVSGHDGDSNDQNLGATRWVNRASGEWQFGGGADSEAGRERDANIIDVVMVPGLGKKPGRTQEELLDYLLPDALRRFDQGRTACVLEATSSLDISPPSISPFPTDGYAHAVWNVLDHAPASFWTKIEDESDIDRAEFQWRPLGDSRWRVSQMVNIVDAYWIADIDPDSLRQDVDVIELVDGTPARPFEARITARDQYGNEAETSLLTFAVPEAGIPYEVALGAVPGTSIILSDGTIVIVPAPKGAPEFDSYDIKVTPLGESGDGAVDLTAIKSSMTYLGVARKLEIVGHKGGDSEPVSTLTSPMTLALHYPTYLAAEIGDEQKIGLFEYNYLTRRWLGMFGAANAEGNAVAADIGRTGSYGLFADARLSYDASKGLSGVRAEPNPFSPNGDGLYDETRISFFLAREADWVTAEIFDIAGEAVRTIKWQLGLTTTGRNAFEIIWDGRDDRGHTVPYGIYVVRVEVRFKVAPYNERENIGIAVIK